MSENELSEAFTFMLESASKTLEALAVATTAVTNVGSMDNEAELH